MSIEWILIGFGSLLVGGGLFAISYHNRVAAGKKREKHNLMATSNLNIERINDPAGNLLENPPLWTLENAADSTDPEIAGNIQTLLDYYNPHRGRLTSWWQKGKAEARNQLLEIINEEQRLVIERGAILEKEVQDGKKRQSDFELYVSQNAAALKEIFYQGALIDAALKAGRTKETHDAITREDELSAIRVREFEKKEKIKLDTLLAEKQETLRLALIAKDLSDIQKINLVQGQIDEIYIEIDGIEGNEKLSDRTKQRMIEDRELIITTLKGDRNARQARLLETDPRRELRGNDEDTNLR